LGLLGFATLSQLPNPKNKIDYQHDEAHQQAQSDQAQFEEYRTVDGVQFLDGGFTFHGSVVHCDEEDDELGEVTDVGAVVVVGLQEGQVHQVVQQKGKAEGQHDEG
jgi:hypothetical protein